MGVHRSNMIVYKCIVNESEFITDAQTESDDGGVEMLWGGTVCKVPAKYIEVGEEDIDIGGNDSAEGADDNKQQVIDLVHNFRYQPMEYSEKEYMTYMKAFCKKCVMYKKEHDMADQVPASRRTCRRPLRQSHQSGTSTAAMLTRTMTARAALSCVDTTEMASHSSITSWTASLPRSTKHDTIRLWLLYSYVYL